MTTRWLAMGTWTKWMIDKRIRLMEFFVFVGRREGQVVPPEWYWPVVAGICALFGPINRTIKSMQAKTMLMSQQTSELEALVTSLITQLDVDGPFSIEEMQERQGHEWSGCWSITHENVEGFLLDQGSWVRVHFETHPAELVCSIKQEIGQLIVQMIKGISEICTLRDSQNKPLHHVDLPAVLPHQLCQIRGREFGLITLKYKHRLQSWTEAEIEEIETDHQSLVLTCQCEPSLKAQLHACDHKTTFDQGWKIVEGRFNRLREFVGGLATMFPNTATVESDFSVLGWEKDEYRVSLTDLSLEGIMQSKQYQELQCL